MRALTSSSPPPPEFCARIRIRIDLRLDEPVAVQYGLYLRDLVTGHWGRESADPARGYRRARAGRHDVLVR